MTTRLIASPRRESFTSCVATALAWSNRDVPPAFAAMLIEPSSTITRCVRRPGITLPNDSRNGLAIAATIS